MIVPFLSIKFYTNLCGVFLDYQQVFTQVDVDFLISYDSYNEKKNFPTFSAPKIVLSSGS